MSERIFYVTLSHENPEEIDLQTHTFAEDYAGAVKRLNESMDNNPDTWNGWTFRVHPEGKTHA